MKYQLVKEKELRVQPVDNSTLIALWLIISIRVRSTQGMPIENTTSGDLPIIAF